MTRHRRLGLWIRTQAPGGILNVQLAGTDARRDHYIPLENRGWTYVVLDPPEEGRFFDYAWPYSFTDLMYTCSNVYGAVKHVHLYYNGLPAGAKVACWIGRIEALEERPLPLMSPALEIAGKSLVLPVSLKPDEYLEMDWAGQCRHFDPNGGLLGRVVPQGTLRVNAGRKSCDVFLPGRRRGFLPRRSYPVRPRSAACECPPPVEYEAGAVRARAARRLQGVRRAAGGRSAYPYSTSPENGHTPRSWIRALAAADFPTPPFPSNKRQQG